LYAEKREKQAQGIRSLKNSHKLFRACTINIIIW